jgi:hypothetical protein
MFKLAKFKQQFLSTGFALAALSSCTYTNYTFEKQLAYIALQMSPQEVSNLMFSGSGHKGGSIIDEQGHAIEAWEYTVGTSLDTYYFYFCDGKLYKWGKPEDWRSEKVQRIEIKSSSDINLKTTSGNG